MTAVLLNGQRDWSMSRDDEGHRTYKISFLVECGTLDGPATAIQCPGLPVYGSYWIIDNDVDLWAWCRWDADVKPLVTEEPNNHFEVTFTFSTKPPDRNDRPCKDTQVEDPLLEPPKINGSFVVYSEEATFDRFGNPLVNSAFERLRGPQVEFDGNRLQIKIEMNVPILDLELLASMKNTVNDAPIWGMPPRCVKLSEIEFERKYYGSCYVYYTLHLTFDTRSDTFDRNILDEGTKVLNGHWDATTGNWILDNVGGKPPDYLNPKHYIRAKDKHGVVMKVILNGAGLPAGVSVGTGTESPIYYLATSTNVGSAPPGGSWMTVVGPISSPRLWNAVNEYPAGTVVSYLPLVNPGGKTQDPDYYLCLQTNTAHIPPSFPAYWYHLPVIPPMRTNAPPKARGLWQSTTNYQVNDYVYLKSTTDQGILVIEKYGESDFTQLGIPLIL